MLIDFELKSRLAPNQVCRKMKRDDESKERYGKNEEPDVAVAAGKENQQQRAPRGNERDQSQNERAERLDIHLVPTQTM